MTALRLKARLLTTRLRLHSLTKLRLKGFSLIEISIVLIIVGVMLGSVLKGQSVLKQVQIKSVADDFTNIRMLITLYLNDYDSNVLSEPDAIWQKLAAANLLQSAEPPPSKLGGTYSVVQEDGHYMLKLAKSGAFLTRVQALGILKRLQDTEKVTVKNSSNAAVQLANATESSDKNDAEKYTVEILLQ
jgi:prepilin-type N-terminal cleavage/methylation domain-containing protein